MYLVKQDKLSWKSMELRITFLNHGFGVLLGEFNKHVPKANPDFVWNK